MINYLNNDDIYLKTYIENKDFNKIYSNELLNYLMVTKKASI